MISMIRYFFCFFYVCFLQCFSLAQSTKLDYTIAPWFENKKAAASLTFDDAVNGQFTVALPLLNQYGFKATFFVTIRIIPQQLGDWHLIREAAGAGHEIANHTLNHPYLHKLDDDSIRKELMRCNQLIEMNIPAHKSVTMAYPYGDGGNETNYEQKVRSIVKENFIGARATRNRSIPYNPYNFGTIEDNYYTVNSDMIADSASMADLEKHLDEAIEAGGWYVPTYHGIENGWIIVSKKIFEEHLQIFDKRKNELWIAPFEDVLKYHKERNCASLKVLAEDKNEWTLALTDTLSNDTIWNHALTINLSAPEWKIKNIRQSGTTIPFIIEKNRIIFHAVPGKNRIIITKL